MPTAATTKYKSQSKVDIEAKNSGAIHTTSLTSLTSTGAKSPTDSPEEAFCFGSLAPMNQRREKRPKMPISALAHEHAEGRGVAQGPEQVRGRLLVGCPQYVQERILACGADHRCALGTLLAPCSIRMDNRADDIE